MYKDDTEETQYRDDYKKYEKYDRKHGKVVLTTEPLFLETVYTIHGTAVVNIDGNHVSLNKKYLQQFKRTCASIRLKFTDETLGKYYYIRLDSKGDTYDIHECPYNTRLKSNCPTGSIPYYQLFPAEIEDGDVKDMLKVNATQAKGLSFERFE